MLPIVKEYKNYIKKYNKIIVVILLIAVSIIFNLVQGNQDEIVVNDSSTEVEVESEDQIIESKEGYVDISGEVENPGVYSIDGHTRLYQIIDKAGGVTENADLNSINQAEILEDGAKIIIPEIGGENDIQAGSKSDGGSGLININKASKEELMSLNGIGEVIAERIMEYRSSTMFTSIEDIKNVSGIGESTFAKIRDDITT